MRYPHTLIHLLAPLCLAFAAGGAAAAVAMPISCGAASPAAAVCLSAASGTPQMATATINDGVWRRLGAFDGVHNASSGRLLSGTVTGSSGVVGIGAAAWDLYDHLALGLYVGDGDDGDSPAAGWILLELPDGALTASWAVLSQPARYAALFGVNGPVQQLQLQALPEPGSIALAGLALAGLLLARQAARKPARKLRPAA